MSMKRDFNIKKRNVEARKVYKKIAEGHRFPEKPQENSNVEKCTKCSKGLVRIDLFNEPEWTYSLEKSTVINVGGHTLLFLCAECGSHICKRGVGLCKSNYPKYKT